jgi:hypothetical protein
MKWGKITGNCDEVVQNNSNCDEVGQNNMELCLSGAEQQAIVMKWGRTTGNCDEVGQNNRQLL